MHHSLRSVAALSCLGWVTLFGLHGCSSRLGSVQATQNGGSMGHANLPDITVERAKECVEFDGRQLEKGRIVVESTVEVNEDGDKVGVTVSGIPETARDFGVCIRKVLQDMPIAEQSLDDAVKTLQFNRKHAGDSQYALERFIEVIPGVPIVESELVLEADGYTVVLPVTVKARAKLEELIDIDEATLKTLGQMALDSLGYEEIMNRAEQQGWVKRVPLEQTQSAGDKRFIADGASSASVQEIVKESFRFVMTKTAPVAVTISQLDSPAPGYADLVAVGIFAVSLVAVGGVSVYIYVTNNDAPTPTPQPQPPPAPTPQVPPLPPPQPDCPRNESFVPKRTDNATGCTDKKGNLQCHSRRHPPCAGVHTHGVLHYQEVRRGKCIAAQSDAVRCDGPFTISGPCGSVSTTTCGKEGLATSGIFEE